MCFIYMYSIMMFVILVLYISSRQGSRNVLFRFLYPTPLPCPSSPHLPLSSVLALLTHTRHFSALWRSGALTSTFPLDRRRPVPLCCLAVSLKGHLFPQYRSRHIYLCRGEEDTSIAFPPCRSHTLTLKQYLWEEARERGEMTPEGTEGLVL